MASNIDQTNWNTRERAVSSDMNRNNRLMHRAISEAVRYLASGATARTGCFGDSFIATPQAGTMKTAIGPGLALFADSTQVYPDSTAVWVESREIREVTHDAADVLARYDVVEMRPGTLVSSTQARDVFDPVTGTFTVQNLTKETRSYPEFQIRKGTPSATPSIPAGTAGWIPLSYVLVPGGAVALDAQDVVYCRPILNAAPAETGYTFPDHETAATDVKGGGVTGDGATAVATLAAKLSGRFPGSSLRFQIAAASAFTLSTLTHDGGGLPAASGTVYLYAVAPPYPAGYDASLAAREIWSPKTIYGSSGGFENPTRQSGCIVISSTTKTPSSSDPSGASSGTASINHTFFSAAASSVDMKKAVYIGSAYYDQPGGFYVAQRCFGSHCGANRKSGADIEPSFPIAAPTLFSLGSSIAGDPSFALPAHVSRVRIVSRFNIGVNSWIYVQATDQFETVGGAKPVFIYDKLLDVNALQSETGWDFWAHLNSSQQISVVRANANLAGPCVLYVYEWEDPTIALR